MEQAELETLVSELEGRVERLRSLYDQYFMGIEKLEPLVPKKDVERRLAILRKEQIKNTGLRFRFNQIVSRYNTFLTYWMRIARQIEEGRYKRDVMRATKRFGIDPTREAPSESMLDDDADARSREPQVFEIPDEPIEEVYQLDAEPEEPEGIPIPDMAFDLDEVGDPFEEADPFPKPRELPVGGPKVRIAPRIAGAGAFASAAPPPAPSVLDTERRIPVARPALPSQAPSPSPMIVPSQSPPRPMLRPAASGAPPGSSASSIIPTTKAGLGMDSDPRIITAKRASIPDALEAAPASARPPLVRQVAESAPRRPGTLPSAGVPAISVPPGARTSPSIPAIQPRASAAPAPVVVRPAAPAGAGASRPPAAPPAANPLIPTPGSRMISAATVSASASRPPASPGAPSAPAPSATPSAAARPLTTPTMTSAIRPPGAGAAMSTPPAAPRAPVGDLSDNRFKQIYSQYVETRRKHNEPTGAITRDALARQLSESTNRLKQKHEGKSVDFEVVVRDGKTILRPVVK